MVSYRNLLFLSCFFLISWGSAQNKLPFEDEVKDIQKRTDSIWDSSKETIVFTGSSSIRLWEDLQERFPENQILNTGFGGSQSSDLANFTDELILNYNPAKVFIYEGDNDIFDKKRPKQIIETFNTILNKLEKEQPDMDVVLISAKPSISRWHLRGKYRRLNRKLQKIAQERSGVAFVDVWTTMLNKRKLKKDLFIEDGLHMNTKGYDLWYNEIKDFIPEVK
nr:SGNH/GDSL hydrolase family protein [Allomuricauda sp.]